MTPTPKTLEKILAEYDERAAKESYSEYDVQRIGCCGGDYCHCDHEGNIKSFISSSFKSHLKEAMLEILPMEKPYKEDFKCGGCEECEACRLQNDDEIRGYNQALAEIRKNIENL